MEKSSTASFYAREMGAEYTAYQQSYSGGGRVRSSAQGFGEGRLNAVRSNDQRIDSYLYSTDVHRTDYC